MGFVVIALPAGLVMMFGYLRNTMFRHQSNSNDMDKSKNKEKYINRILVKTVIRKKSSQFEIYHPEPLRRQRLNQKADIYAKDKKKKNRIFSIDMPKRKPVVVLDTTSVCAICWNGYKDGDSVCISRNQSCSHVFHEECITPWLLKRSNCPMCRSDFLHRS